MVLEKLLLQLRKQKKREAYSERHYDKNSDILKIYNMLSYLYDFFLKILIGKKYA